MRYGFIIDQDRCIGCHACTVACKEEHNVPVGVYRTWVKYIEKGEFPHTSRHFAVMRCNHCDDAPCIEICPTVALFKRPDGIVDFDNDRCIGCKSCMQACPYDALHINPDSGTAAKCNFCAHRIELGLEPACVIVCPTQAIISGDLDDPESRPARIIATQKVISRKPHKGTQPKLFYLGVEGDLLQPTRAGHETAYLWSRRRLSDHAQPAAPPNPNNFKPGRPRVVYDVAHDRPWGKEVSAYLFTKSIAAGVLVIAAFFSMIGLGSGGILLGLISPVVAMVFTALTAMLLVLDLERPGRFYYLLTKSNPHSWLVRGGFILMLYGLLALAWFCADLLAGSVPFALQLAAATGGIAAAAYTAFLFAQAKGRDLWQNSVFLWHLLVQAIVAGSAALLLAEIFFGDSDASITRALIATLAVSLSVSVLMILGEVMLAHVSEDVRMATDLLIKGALAARFWGLALGAGSVAPVILAFMYPHLGSPRLSGVAIAILALAGLWIFEDLWVEAGQSVPLS